MKDSHPASFGKTQRIVIFHKAKTQHDEGRINQKLIQLLVKDEN
jgi:hypothetical protein